MTTDELKGILNTIITTIQTIKADYSPELSSSIEVFLKNFTPEKINLIARIFQLDEDVINNNITNMLKIEDGLNSFFLTDESDKVVTACQNLLNRPLLLMFIAWYLG